MVLVYIHDIENAANLLQSAYQLSVSLKKEFGIVSFYTDEDSPIDLEKNLAQRMQQYTLETSVILVKKQNIYSIADICEQSEVSFLFLQLTKDDKKTIGQYLKATRDLRIPYILWKGEYELLDLKKVLVPITFLEEDLEKAQFASAFGRFCDTEVVVLQANDYGSKAKKNVQRMIGLFEKFAFPYTTVMSDKDSFGVDKASLSYASQIHVGLVIVTASREYGLDDIFFGPKELHVVKKSHIPILLINPRADLYALCD